MIRSLAALTALSLAACAGASQADVAIDFAGVCYALDLALIDQEDELSSFEVHDFAASDPSGAGWALITQDSDLLALERVPADPDAALIPLGVPVAMAADIDLLSGPDLGEVWVRHTGDNYLRLWRINDDGLVAEHNFGASFPGVDGPWERRLIFVGRQPMLLAAPRSSPSKSLEFMLARLSEDLTINMLWELPFGSECVDMVNCVPGSYPTIHILDVADADTNADAPALVLFEFERVYDEISTQTTGVATLQISLNQNNLPLAIKREYFDLLWGHSTNSVRVNPGQIARDNAGFYILAGITDSAADDPELSANDIQNDRLIHHNTLTSSSQIIARFPKYTNSHLLQLTNQVGLGQILDRFWYAARVVGSSVDIGTIDDIDISANATISRAGHHHVLIRGETTRRGRIVCAEDPQQD